MGEGKTPVTRKFAHPCVISLDRLHAHFANTGSEGYPRGKKWSYCRENCGVHANGSTDANALCYRGA